MCHQKRTVFHLPDMFQTVLRPSSDVLS